MASSDAIKPTVHVINHWATRDGMKYMGEATSTLEIPKLKKLL